MLHYVQLILRIGFLKILLLLECNAQEPVFSHISIEQGIPSSEVYHSIEDSKGYMWFATDRGVAKYDGYEFEVFTTDDGLIENVVFSLFEDVKGRIWFVSYSMLLSYYYEGEIVPYKYNDIIKKSSQIGSQVSSFIVDDMDNVHIGTNFLGKITILSNGSVQNNTLESVKTKRGVHFSEMKNLSFHYGIKASKKNSKLNATRKYTEFNFYVNDTDAKTIRLKNTNNQTMIKIANSSGTSSFFSFSGSIYNFNEKGEVKLFYESDSKIIYLFETESSIYVGTYKDGGYRLNKETRTIDFEFLKNLSVSSINEDNEQGYWITTLENGIYYTPNLYNFTLNSNNFGDEKYIAYVTGNKQDEVIVATRDNNVFLFKDENLLYSTTFSSNNHTQISSLIYDSIKQQYVIAGKNIKVYKNGVLETLYEQVSTRDIEYKSSDTLLSCMRYLRGVSRESIINYPGLKGCQCVEKLTNGKILVGSMTGLHQLINDSVVFIGHSSELLQNRIVDIKEHAQVDYIIATRGDGLVIVEGERVSNITTADGLASNQINSIHVDLQNRIWVATNKGVSLINNINAVEIKNISVKHGLLSNEINSIYISQNKAWIGTKKGLNIVDLKILTQKSKTFPVIIKSIKTPNQELTASKVSNYIKLDYNSSFIEIRFVALNYRSLGNIKYKYRIKGLNENWIETNSNKVQLPSIPSGNYVFEVLASNEDGIWNANPTEIRLEISYPFWQTWWFYFLNVIAVATLISSFYILRLRRIRERNRLNLEITNYREQAFKAQMNPHFIFNSLNSIQSFIIKNDKKESNRYLAKFAKLMRLILSNSQSNKVLLEDELLALQLYLELESVRFKNKLNFSIKVDSDINQGSTLIPTLIIQPYVENAIWHGVMHKKESGNVDVTIEKKGDSLVCSIQDDGIGRLASEQMKIEKSHKSAGSSITEKRLKMIAVKHNHQFNLKITDLKDENQNIIGTLVQFSIPNIKT